MDSDQAIEQLKAAAVRLDTLVGLLDETDSCIEAVRQIQQVKAHLFGVHKGLLIAYMEQCLTALKQQDNDWETALGGIREAFCYLNWLVG